MNVLNKVKTPTNFLILTNGIISNPLSQSPAQSPYSELTHPIAEPLYMILDRPSLSAVLGTETRALCTM
jgi:hypothetical protein